MLKLIKFEIKKLLNIKTLICFLLLLGTFFGFVIYNDKLDKKYAGEDKISEYTKELILYQGKFLKLDNEGNELRQKKVEEKGIQRTDPNYEEEYLKVSKEIGETEWGKQFMREYEFYNKYIQLVSNQINSAREFMIDYEVDFEVKKNQLILEEIDSGLIDGKMIQDKNRYIITEDKRKTQKIMDYNQMLLDKNVQFLHSPYEMKGFNFIDKISKTLMPFLIPLIVVIVCIDSLSKEKDTGSIKFLLLQPQSRKKVFISKFITCVVVVLLVLIMSMSIVFIYVSMTNGLEKSNYPVEYNKITLKSLVQNDNTQYELVTISKVKYTMLLLVFLLLYTIFFVSVCMLFSTLSENTINAFVLGMSIVLISYLFNIVDINSIWAKFIPMLNTNYENIICQCDSLTGLTSILLLISYSVILFVISVYAFIKRDVVC